MRFIRFQFAVILILTAGLCLPLPGSAQTSEQPKEPEQPSRKISPRKGKPAAGSKAPQKKAEEQASMPAAPPPPTPEQMPSQPPTVTYQNGQLAIVAPNSTLSDILHAVRNKTGADIDIPPGANERVVSSFGPGPARDVLTSLLNGSHFNYVMVGTVADPNAVAQVILTPRAGGETPVTVQAGQAGMPIRPGVPPQPYPQQPQMQSQTPVEEQPASSDGMDEEDTSQDTNADNAVDQGAPEQGQGTDGQNPNQPTVKTPEQLLQELQRQQQMTQQQQQPGQQQPQVVTPTPPPDSRPKPQ